MRHCDKSLLVRSLAAVVAILSCTHCTPKGYLYANNASNDATTGPYIYKIDLATGDVVDIYTNLSIGRGGIGVAVIGNTMYYASALSNCVYRYDLTAKVDYGQYFCVTGPDGLASLAFDGTNLWVQERTGTSPGTLFTCDLTVAGTPTCVAKFFPPTTCVGTYCDALEYTNTPIQPCTLGPLLLSNRGDFTGPYDAYPASSPVTPCHSSFIIPLPPSTQPTGLAWDSQFFYTADLVSKTIEVFDPTGAPVSTITLATPPNYKPQLEDLSIDYARLYCFPPGRTVYTNGPVNGQIASYNIAGSNVVSNSFVITQSTAINAFCFGAWVTRTSAPASVSWSITPTPNGGLPYAKGVASKGKGLISDFLFDNTTGNCYYPRGCSVYQAAVSFPNLILQPGTYYLNLTHGSDDHGEEMHWDVNYGINCSSPGCPSIAWSNTTTSIPSESFIIRYVNPSPCVDCSTKLSPDPLSREHNIVPRL